MQVSPTSHSPPEARHDMLAATFVHAVLLTLGWQDWQLHLAGVPPRCTARPRTMKAGGRSRHKPGNSDIISDPAPLPFPLSPPARAGHTTPKRRASTRNVASNPALSGALGPTPGGPRPCRHPRAIGAMTLQLPACCRSAVARLRRAALREGIAGVEREPEVRQNAADHGP